MNPISIGPINFVVEPPGAELGWVAGRLVVIDVVWPPLCSVLVSKIAPVMDILHVLAELTPGLPRKSIFDRPDLRLVQPEVA